MPITISVPDDVIADLLGHPQVIAALERLFTNAQRAPRQAPQEQLDTTALDLDEAASLLGLAPSTVRDKAARRELPAIKTGKKWRFFRADLIKWLESNRRRTQEETDQLASQYIRSPKKRR